jgi:hypothetical protein
MGAAHGVTFGSKGRSDFLFHRCLDIPGGPIAGMAEIATGNQEDLSLSNRPW